MNSALDQANALRRRALANRPSPALPLALLAVVVAGGIGISFIQENRYGSAFFFDDLWRLGYWAIATILAFAVTMWVARRQGYRSGVWVDRKALVIGGVVALAIIVVMVLSSGRTSFLPGDLTLRGNLPLLALTIGVAVWAYHERRPGLWVVAGLLAPLTLLANLYNMENVLFRLGVPYFRYAGDVVDLGFVAIVLLMASAVFGVAHRRAVRRNSTAGR